MSITEIEAAITRLSPDQINELMSWLEEHYSAIWDRQIADDLESGRLDAVIADAEREYDAGLGRSL